MTRGFLMRLSLALVAVLSAGGFLLHACGPNASLPISAGIGPDPALPPPDQSLIPTVAIAPANRWPADAMPAAAEGLRVQPFAAGLDHPRQLHVLPNGDVIVAESNAQPSEPGGLRARIEKWVMKRAGAVTPSADRITLLRDTDGDGAADQRSVLLSNLTSPFGMAWIDGLLYVANTDGLVAFPYALGADYIETEPRILAALPAGDPNRHWTKGLAASPDGARLYVSVGSNSDHGENGLDAEDGRAAIHEIELATGASRIFATGLRNPVSLAFEPATDALWTVVNERDELGGDLVPDYLTKVEEGAFYGWPWLYYGTNRDPRVPGEPPQPEARRPDYALGSHVAPLGLTFAEGARLGSRYAEGAFIGLHGSWNRLPRSGYAVIFIPFADGAPSGPPLTVLGGFLDDDEARGRPVGVAIDATGALLVADDVGNVIWRVSAAP